MLAPVVRYNPHDALTSHRRAGLLFSVPQVETHTAVMVLRLAVGRRLGGGGGGGEERFAEAQQLQVTSGLQLHNCC